MYILFFLGSLLWIQSACAKSNQPFEGFTDIGTHFNIEIWGGGLAPLFELQNHLSNGFAVGTRISSPYYRSLHIQGDVFYSAILQESTRRTIHVTKLGLGLSYPLFCIPLEKMRYSSHPKESSFFIQSLSSFRTGLGLNSLLIKRDSQGANENSRHLLLDDNELEFGMYPFIHGSIPLFKLFSNKLNSFKLTYGGEWNITFSEPRWSHLFLMYLGVRWDLW
jgi:hypothetical protein